MISPRRLGSLTLLASAALSPLWGTPAHAQQLITTNGGFELANLNGWLTVNQASSTGTFQIGDNTLVNGFGPISPVENYNNAGASAGRYYAVTDSLPLKPGTDAGSTMLLFRNIDLSGIGSFTNATLTFDLAVQDYTGFGPRNSSGTLRYDQYDNQQTLIPTQFIRVDLLKKDAFTNDPFTLVGSDVLQNLFLTLPDPNPNFIYQPTPNYTSYSFDIASLLNAQKGLGNQEVGLRFSVVSSFGGYHANVDNVSLLATSATTVTPELPGGALLLPALLPLGFVAARKRRKA